MRIQQNSLVRTFKIEDPFFTTVPVHIVFLHGYLEREFIKKSVDIYTEKSVPNFKIEDPCFMIDPVQIGFLHEYLQRDFIQKSVVIYP